MGGSPALLSQKRSLSMASLTGEGSPALSKKARRKGFESNFAVLKSAEFFVNLRSDALRPFRGRHFEPKLEVDKSPGTFKTMKRSEPTDRATRGGEQREETHADAIFWEEGHGPTLSELARLEEVAMTPPIILAGQATGVGRTYAQQLQKLFVQNKEVLIYESRF